MTTTPLLLTALETCPRQAFWRCAWERTRLDATEILKRGIVAGLTSKRPDFGEVGGEECMGLGAEPGIDTTHYNQHSEIMHLACIADLVSIALRKPQEGPWALPGGAVLPNGMPWVSDALLDATGRHLRRVVLVSNWSDDRHYSEARSWFSLGEVCALELPMQQAVIVLGPYRDGKRHGPWTRGLRHPMNRKLRFRKRNLVNEPFKETWEQIWREDYSDITTGEWLQGMLEDGVLPDVCFKVDIEVPEKAARQRILEMAARKLDRLAAMTELPDPQLTGCDWPRPCMFRTPCHGGIQPRAGVYREADPGNVLVQISRKG